MFAIGGVSNCIMLLIMMESFQAAPGVPGALIIM